MGALVWGRIKGRRKDIWDAADACRRGRSATARDGIGVKTHRHPLGGKPPRAGQLQQHVLCGSSPGAYGPRRKRAGRRGSWATRSC